MSGRFVRASKYRHVFGRPSKKEQCFDNLRISNNAWDTNLVKANPEYISVNWEASGGGAFAVIPQHERGKLPDRIPLFRGHTAVVLDTDWNPFHDRLIASGSDDGKVFLWTVPEDFTVRPDVKPDDVQDVAPAAKLSGHARKVGHVLFNPSAQNVLASASGDYTVKLWDVEAQDAKLALKHPDMIQSMSWSANGSLLVTTCRDKKLRVWDTRQEKAVIETPGHTGAKNSRAVWMGDRDRVATTGFSKMSDRQLGLWDIKAPREPLNGFDMLDQISGICMPFWDDGNQILYLAGKGDGNIRYYEYQNDKFEYLSQHSSADPQRGVAFIPKRGVDTHENEVARCFRTVDDRLVEPISFIVPRRAEAFQDDIYPPCVGLKPAMSSADWFGGKEGLPPKISLASIHDGEAPKEVPGDYKPPQSTPAAAATSTPSPTKTPTETAPKPEPAAAPVARGPPPSMKDNQASIANMASKFADKDEPAEDDDDDASSFEEVSKPVERPRAAVVSQPKAADPPKPEPAAAPSATPSALPKAAEQPTSSAHRSTPSSSSATGTAAEGLRGHLVEIKSMLESQGRMILELRKDVEQLKGNNSRVRELELELEQARSGR